MDYVVINTQAMAPFSNRESGLFRSRIVIS